MRSIKKENIRFEKDNSTRKLSKKFDRLAKYIYYIEISLNTSFFRELIPKQQRKKHVHREYKLICSQQALTILPNICIIYLSYTGIYSVRYTGSKTISFTSSLRVVKQIKYQGQVGFGRTKCQDTVTEDN